MGKICREILLRQRSEPRGGGNLLWESKNARSTCRGWFLRADVGRPGYVVEGSERPHFGAPGAPLSRLRFELVSRERSASLLSLPAARLPADWEPKWGHPATSPSNRAETQPLGGAFLSRKGHICLLQRGRRQNEAGCPRLPALRKWTATIGESIVLSATVLGLERGRMTNRANVVNPLGDGGCRC